MGVRISWLPVLPLAVVAIGAPARATSAEDAVPGDGEAYHFAQAPSGGAAASNAAHRLTVALAAGALDVESADAWRLGLRWTGLGRGARVAPVERPRGPAEADGDRASYRRADGSEERYVNGPAGVEQVLVLPDGPRATPARAVCAPAARLSHAAPRTPAT
jgi:hypothetical protein